MNNSANAVNLVHAIDAHITNSAREQWLQAKTHSKLYTNGQLMRMHEQYGLVLETDLALEESGIDEPKLSIANYDYLYNLLSQGKAIEHVTNMLLYKHNVYDIDAAMNEYYALIRAEV